MRETPTEYDNTILADTVTENITIPQTKTIPTRIVWVSSRVLDEIESSGLPPSGRQQAYYIASKLCHRKRKRLHCETIRRLCPLYRRVWPVLLKHEVRKGRKYSTHGRCKEYWLANKPDNMVEVEINNQTLLRKLENGKKDRMQRTAKYVSGKTGVSEVGTLWMIQCLERIGSTPHARKLLVDLIEGSVSDEQRRTYERGLRLLDGQIQPDYSFNKDKTKTSGRLWHTFTGLPEIVRAHSTLDDYPTVEIDMSKSQAAILAAMWTPSEEDKRLLQGIILNGEFYNAYEPYYEADREQIARWNEAHPTETIDSVKGLVNKILMGFPNKRWKTYCALKKELPSVMHTIDRFKWESRNYGADGEKTFAKRLHQTEATIIADVAEQCHAQGIPCYPVFDCMGVPAEYEDVVKGFFAKSMTKVIGFDVPTTVKKRSCNELADHNPIAYQYTHEAITHNPDPDYVPF